MAEELEIQIPWMRYDLTLPLIEGRVPIKGVKLVPDRFAPAGTVFGPDEWESNVIGYGHGGLLSSLHIVSASFSP